jgi:predicted DNA-binding transcriptional regulator YafY
MRASRLLSILLLLQARGRMTARQLADELEVSARTIYRDVESLHAAGIPLYGDAGHAGGYRLLDGFRTRLTGLTEAEADSFVLAGMPGPADELGHGAAVAALQLKLQAALPRELRDRADRAAQRFHLDAPGWYQDGDRSDHLAATAEAVWRQRRVRVRYRGWAGEVTRVLDPLGMVLKGGRWYVVAGPRPATYRVNQILDLEPLDETFDRPDDFDLAAFWRAHVVDFRQRLFQGEAVIRLSPAGRERLSQTMGALVADAVDATASAPDAEGWVTATIPVESPTHTQGELLRVGAGVEVLAPADLRARIAEAARSLVRMYG